jgi:hypothetical protein
MTFNRSHFLPLLVLLLGACSANGPDPEVPGAAKARGGSAGLAGPSDLRQSVRGLTSRGAENLEVSAGPIPGSRVVRIRAGYSEVMLAKTNPDGTVSTRCVDSSEGAEAFLDETSPSTLAKAAQ